MRTLDIGILVMSEGPSSMRYVPVMMAYTVDKGLVGLRYSHHISIGVC